MINQIEPERYKSQTMNRKIGEINYAVVADIVDMFPSLDT